MGEEREQDGRDEGRIPDLGTVDVDRDGQVTAD